MRAPRGVGPVDRVQRDYEAFVVMSLFLNQIEVEGSGDGSVSFSRNFTIGGFLHGGSLSGSRFRLARADIDGTDELEEEIEDDERREEIMKEYYRGLMQDGDAALIKCIDRCNNLTTMSWGLSRQREYRMIRETEQYILPLLETVRKQPEYNDAAWLLKYQMVSMLDIYKRLL